MTIPVGVSDRDRVMRVLCVGEPLARIHADILVMGFFEDVRPLQGLTGQFDWLARGGLSRLIVGGRVSGRLKETILMALPTFATPRVMCIGLGKSTTYSYLVLHQVIESLRAAVQEMGVRTAAVEILGAHTRGIDAAIAARTCVKAWYAAAAAEVDLTLVAPRGTQPRQLEQRLRDMGVEGAPS
ncbi:MAG: M17 family peptidase N-terminal domain-containing protein [Nitrospiria bacterium]